MIHHRLLTRASVTLRLARWTSLVMRVAIGERTITAIRIGVSRDPLVLTRWTVVDFLPLRLLVIRSTFRRRRMTTPGKRSAFLGRGSVWDVRRKALAGGGSRDLAENLLGIDRGNRWVRPLHARRSAERGGESLRMRENLLCHCRMKTYLGWRAARIYIPSQCTTEVWVPSKIVTLTSALSKRDRVERSPSHGEKPPKLAGCCSTTLRPRPHARSVHMISRSSSSTRFIARNLKRAHSYRVILPAVVNRDHAVRALEIFVQKRPLDYSELKNAS